GPVRVIPQEIAGLSCQSVDLVLPGPDGAMAAEPEALETLLAELAGPPAREPVVALRGAARFVRCSGTLGLPAAPAPRPRGGVVLITGGLGGLGGAFAAELAGRPGARLALVGRTVLPPRAAFADWLAAHGEADPVSARVRRIQALEERGAQVLALAADVTDEAALAAAPAEIAAPLRPDPR